MKKNKLTIILISCLSILIIQSPLSVKAAIRIPIIGKLGNNPDAAASGSIFANFFVSLWRTIISMGSLLMIVYFLWGAIEWMTSGDNTEGVKKGRHRMTNGAIGLLLLSSSFMLITFIGKLIFGGSFNILQLVIPAP